MEEFEFDVGGAPVVFSNKKEPPINPLNRPEIKYKNFFVSIIGYIITVFLSTIICKTFLSKIICEHISISESKFTVLFTVVLSVIYISIILKRALIWLVHLYQHYAPDKIRLKCVFEPSCSEYMILSIKKYGAVIGALKGCIRLLKCHPPNGGIDYP